MPRLRPFPALLAGALALAALLRLGALRAEFWFDEVWSWEFARAAASPWQLLAGAGWHHDNNHKLNTLFLWLYPAGAGWWWYRLHSLVAGLAAVGAAALAAGRRGRAEAAFAALLVAGNYWLVLCSAEARGYAPAVCCALLALYALEGYLRPPHPNPSPPSGGRGAEGEGGRRRFLVLFWLAVILGFAAHLTFLHAYLALGLWSVAYLSRRRRFPGDELRQLAACHLVPAAFLAALYVVDVRHMELGGGPPQPTAAVVGRLLGLGLGGPPSAAWAPPLAACALALFVLGLRLLAREGRQQDLLFAAAVVGSPALLLLTRPAFLFERYFLIAFVFLLLLISCVLGDLWRRSRRGALVAGTIAAMMTFGGAVQVLAFERGGRGRFLDALAHVERCSPPGEVSVAGDYDFRVRKFYAFYAPYLPNGSRLVYREQGDLPRGGADWLLVHRLDDRHPPPPRLRDADGNAYRLEGGFPATPYGGWGWYVYRNTRGG